MNRQEFIDELRQSLVGKVPDQVCWETCRYYEDFILSEMRSGRPEAEVLEELGRPSLIGRSVIAAQTGDRAADMEYTEDGKTRKLYRGQGQKKKEKKPAARAGRAWYTKILYALCLILLILVVFVVMKGLMVVLFAFGIPILLLLGIVYLVMYFAK